MKTFKGTRTLEEITKIASDNQWSVDMRRYNQGSDYITLYDEKDEMLTILYNTFNGQFSVFSSISKDDKPIATHMSEDLENQEWYNEVLNMFYIPA